MEPRKIEIRCTHADPDVRDPRVRYICPTSAVFWVLGSTGIILYIVSLIFYVVLAAIRR